MSAALVCATGLIGVQADAQQPAQPASAARPAPTSEQVEQMMNDWPNLKRFHDADNVLPLPSADERRVVFMGDSITQGWANYGVPPVPADSAKPWVNRGIGGQTTPQMLLRFRQDVIDLKPRAVVILAGINDIAGNTGDMTLKQTEDNLASMAELAQAHGIRVMMCSILPAFDFPWRPGREPGPKVVAINTWMKSYATSHNHIYVDYYSAMADERGGLPKTLSNDGVHPTKAGYAIMTPLVEAGIAKALSGK